MANIIDLSVLIKEPLIFKMPNNDDIFEIPGGVSTDFTIKLMKCSQDMKDLKDEIMALEKLKTMTLDILNLDKSRKIDMIYVEDNLDDIRVMKVIISKMMEHIRNIAEDPNSNSLKLEDK